MKKIFLFLIITLYSSIYLTGCGQNGKSTDSEIKKENESQEKKEGPVFKVSMAPETVKISGDLSDYFVVVDKIYKLQEGFQPKLYLEIERTDKEFPFEIPEAEYIKSFRGVFGDDINEPYLFAGLGMEMRDPDGNVVEKHDARHYGIASQDDIERLFKLKPGEKLTLEEIFVPTPALTFTISSQLQNNYAKDN